MLILGSQSVRRADILRFFKLPFKQIPSSFDENKVEFKGNPIEYVETLAKGKALDLAKAHPHDTILTADTVVYHQSKVYNKPESFEESCRMLKTFSGSWQTVYTGVSLSHQGKLYFQHEATDICFNTLSDEEIKQYQTKLNNLDKAGAYTLSESGYMVIKEIRGCFYNALGLPINTLRQLLTHAEVNLWDML